jgi:hypothetical protein
MALPFFYRGYLQHDPGGMTLIFTAFLLRVRIKSHPRQLISLTSNLNFKKLSLLQNSPLTTIVILSEAKNLVFSEG